jgi:CheY-like chemotaxis protein
VNWSILVVDDEPMARDLLRLMLERAGFKISEASDGLDALEKVSHLRPDLIILDVMMPEMDGFEVCRALRSDAATASLPVIMLSAKTHPQAIREGKQAGANKYLSKLTPRLELIQHINELLTDDSASE